MAIGPYGTLYEDGSVERGQRKLSHDQVMDYIAGMRSHATTGRRSGKGSRHRVESVRQREAARRNLVHARQARSRKSRAHIASDTVRKHLSGR